MIAMEMVNVLDQISKFEIYLHTLKNVHIGSTNHLWVLCITFKVPVVFVWLLGNKGIKGSNFIPKCFIVSECVYFVLMVLYSVSKDVSKRRFDPLCTSNTHETP